MTDYLHIQPPPDQIRGISSIGLAHMGDAVYELLVRTWLCAHGKATGKGLHRATVALVRPRAGGAGPAHPAPADRGGAGGVPPGPQR